MNHCEKETPAASPVGSKIRSCVLELRCLSQGLEEPKFLKMKAVINTLEGCALHIEDIEQHIPVNSFSTPVDSKKIADELGASLEN